MERNFDRISIEELNGGALRNNLEKVREPSKRAY
jgi:hypothetical protein